MRAGGRRGRAARARRARVGGGAGRTPGDAAPRRHGGRPDHDGGPVDHGDRAHLDRHRPRARAARHRRLPDARRRTRCSTCCAGRSPTAATALPDPIDVQRHAPFLGREVPIVDAGRVPRHRLHRGAPARRPVRRLAGRRSTLVEHVRPRGRRRRAVRRTRTTPASTRSRTSSACTTVCSRHELAFADRLVGELSTRCRPTRLLVTSDHGQVHLEADVVDRHSRAGCRCDEHGRRRPVPLSVRDAGQAA